MNWGLESVLGHGPTLSRSDILFRKATRRAAELGGVGVFVRAGRSSRPDLSDFSALPRAILVPEAVAIPASNAVAAALDPAFDPRRAALLETNVSRAPDPGWDARKTWVRLVARESGRIELDASAPAPAVLVLFESFDPGWRAWIDGSEADVYRADAAFRGVRLPAGSHRVRVEYHPRGLKEGVGIAAAGILGLVLAGIRLGAASP
jgi:hypothetical protein